MLIYLLAIAMTVLMLVATALAMHEEAQRATHRNARRALDGFRAPVPYRASNRRWRR